MAQKSQTPYDGRGLSVVSRLPEGPGRGDRVAECAGLENRCTFTGTEGSNPSLSAFRSRGDSAPRCPPWPFDSPVCDALQESAAGP